MDKRRAMMEEYRHYREMAVQTYQEQRSLRLELRGGMTSTLLMLLCSPSPITHPDPSLLPGAKSLAFVYLSGVDTDELDSNVDDWEEETIEFFINEEIIPLGDL